VSQQQAEIRIRRNEDTVLLGRTVEDRRILGCLYPLLPNVHRIMPLSPQALRDLG
jgi:hypothetical protein